MARRYEDAQGIGEVYNGVIPWLCWGQWEPLRDLGWHNGVVIEHYVSSQFPRVCLSTQLGAGSRGWICFSFTWEWQPSPICLLLCFKVCLIGLLRRCCPCMGGSKVILEPGCVSCGSRGCYLEATFTKQPFECLGQVLTRSWFPCFWHCESY